MALRLITAGESHGPGLTCIVEGLPAGLELRPEDLNEDMARRQLGHGRGGRMKIERDAAEVTAGVRHGRTLGGPIALQVANRDYANWEERMSPWPVDRRGRRGAPAAARPRRSGGHAEVQADRRAQHPRAGLRPRDRRARRRGSACKAFLRALGVEVRSHVVQIASVHAPAPSGALTPADFAEVDSSPVRCLDARGDRRRWCARSTTLRKANESLGGVFEVQAFGLVPGLGSHVSWEERLDGRLAMAICSIQAIKGVAIGDGFTVAGLPGSQAHDEIFYSERARLLPRDEPRRAAWRAG